MLLHRLVQLHRCSQPRFLVTERVPLPRTQHEASIPFAFLQFVVPVLVAFLEEVLGAVLERHEGISEVAKFSLRQLTVVVPIQHPELPLGGFLSLLSIHFGSVCGALDGSELIAVLEMDEPGEQPEGKLIKFALITLRLRSDAISRVGHFDVAPFSARFQVQEASVVILPTINAAHWALVFARAR